jgi:hypothetical protein
MEGTIMFYSMRRTAVAVALVLAFLLSTVPAQAQPRDPGSSFTLDTSWLEASLSWLRGLLGGDSEALQSRTAGSTNTDTGGGGVLRTGPCIDPYGGGCPGN